MRLDRPTSLLLASLTILVACGDDGETTTSSGSGGAGSSSSATGVSSGTGDATSSASGSDATTSSAGGEGGGTGGTSGEGGAGGAGGAGGGEPLEVIEGPGFRSGDRLRPVYLDGGDGARKLLHWYDLELGLPCRLGADRPGGDTYACYPLGFGARIAFTDEACTQPVFVAPAGDCDARFAGLVEEVELVGANADTAQLGSVATLHERGAPLATPAALYRRSISCHPIELDEGETVHEAVVSTVALATGTLEIEPLDGGLARGVVRTDDGAMQLVGEYDQGTSSRCQYLGDNAAGDWACLPAVVAELVSPTRLTPPGHTNHYVDDACTVQGAAVFTAGLPAPPIPYVVGLGEEQFQVAAFALGAQVDAPYTARTGTCAEEEAAFTVYEVGEALDIAFPSVILRARFPTGGRISGVAPGSDADVLLDTLRGFADTTYEDEGCEPLVFPEENEGGDAPLRCVAGTKFPFGSRSFPTPGDYFSDPACTEPLVEFDGGLAYRRDDVDSVACSAFPSRHEVTRVEQFEPYEGTVYDASGPGCTVYDGSAPFGFARYVGSLGPADFAIVTIVDPGLAAP